MTERSFPRILDGNSSAPKVKTDGTDPPMPMPPMTRQNISQGTEGAKAEATLAIRFKKREYCRHGFLPIRSEKIPQSNPPNNIPMNTAELRNSIIPSSHQRME